jgi:hypothetical protein
MQRHVRGHEIDRNQSVEHVFADIAGFDHCTARVATDAVCDRCGFDQYLLDRIEVDEESVRGGVGWAQNHVGTIRSCGVVLMLQDFIDLLGHLRRLDEGLATERPCDGGGLRHSRSPSEHQVGVAAASGQPHPPSRAHQCPGNQGHDLRATISRCDTAGHSSCSCHAPSFSATTSSQFAG